MGMDFHHSDQSLVESEAMLNVIVGNDCASQVTHDLVEVPQSGGVV
jgi:hypothetical protein